MADVEKGSPDNPGAEVGIGVLALLAAVLSIGVYEIRGEWPAELGGWGVVLFTVLAISLIGYSWLDSR